MNNTERTTLVFLTGLGIGAGLAALFAPRSGEETREWIADTAEQKFKLLRRAGRRSIDSYRTRSRKGKKRSPGFCETARKRLNRFAAKLD